MVNSSISIFDSDIIKNQFQSKSKAHTISKAFKLLVKKGIGQETSTKKPSENKKGDVTETVLTKFRHNEIKDRKNVEKILSEFGVQDMFRRSRAHIFHRLFTSSRCLEKKRQ